MNNTIFYFFYNLAKQSIISSKIIIFFAVYFPYIVILLALGFLFFFRKSWREFTIVFFSGALAVIFDLILKYLIRIPRPFMMFENIHTLFSETGFAFPSGHATFFSALAFSIFFLSKKAGLSAQAGYVFMFFALLIGIARIIAGVHFPIDILGGFTLGALVAYTVAYFLKNV